MDLAKVINDYLQENNLTKTEFAKQAGISFKTLQGWLNIGTKPNLKMAYKLVELLGIDKVEFAYQSIDKDECKTTLGYFFSLVRKSLGIKAEDMGNVLDVCPSTYRQWETGAISPSPVQIPRISRIMHLDFDMAYNWAYSNKATKVDDDIVRRSHNSLVDRFALVGKAM